ncbi:Pilus biogenesis protein, TadE family [Myxococcus hansupus]|uniref:Pilus biogenesis protein, TadE family n=1 Tax=Pseudomyxococcus hansupus TaxID=1297742 RepID=A0A0H4X0P7_9BACT|nr:TadE family protein [Myxococcus hansupus]AKQ69286.1 Pilus biogenesis protein, TadE family [Myxococcus hansupus]
MDPIDLRRRRQSGQVAVESALIIPMMVFIVLGTIQLGMVHHARLMTEYGAYRAARAGIVNHGDCNIMRKATLTALLPTLAPLNGVKSRVDTLDFTKDVHEEYLGTLFTGPFENTFVPIFPKYASGGLPLFRLEVVNPRLGDLDNLFAVYGAHMQAREVDYDDVRDDRIVEANLLSIRLTYFYEMRIPFANWQLHSFYMGREYLDQLRGLQFENQRVGGQSATTYLEQRGAARSLDHRRVSTLAGQRTYVMPLVATWSMRMQSNYFDNDEHGPRRCAVDS